MKLTVLRLLLKRILSLIQITVLMMLIVQITMIIMRTTMLIRLKTELSEPDLANKKTNRTEPNRSFHAIPWKKILGIQEFDPLQNATSGGSLWGRPLSAPSNQKLT